MRKTTISEVYGSSVFTRATDPASGRNKLTMNLGEFTTTHNSQNNDTTQPSSPTALEAYNSIEQTPLDASSEQETLDARVCK